MLKRSTLLHARFPFSLLLLPVFLFALGMSPNLNESRIGIVFLTLHLLLYPASNAYNSFFDKDEKSIGLLKKPPKVTKQLYFFALILDLIAIVIGSIFINSTYACCLLIYGLVSKAYSHPSIRLKKYAVLSTIVTGFFQGCFTYQMAYIGLNNLNWQVFTDLNIWLPGLLTALMFIGSYPITQIYQHEEDRERGDRTLSLMLGIKGTFIFVGTVFTISTLCFVWWFEQNALSFYSIYFIGCLFPVVAFFIWWARKSWTTPTAANYSNTMIMNWLSAILLNIFFLFFFCSVR